MKLILATITCVLIFISVFIQLLIIENLFISSDASKNVEKFSSVTLVQYATIAYLLLLVCLVLVRFYKGYYRLTDAGNITKKNNIDNISYFDLKNGLFEENTELRILDEKIYIKADRQTTIELSKIKKINWRAVGLVESIEVTLKGGQQFYLTSVDGNFIRENHKYAFFGHYFNAGVAIKVSQKNTQILWPFVEELNDSLKSYGIKRLSNYVEELLGSILKYVIFATFAVLPIGFVSFALGDSKLRFGFLLISSVVALIVLYLFLAVNYRKYALKLYNLVGAHTLRIR